MTLDSPSASLDRCPEDIGIIPIVVAELKFRDIKRQIFLADFVEAPHDPAFDLCQAPGNRPLRGFRENITLYKCAMDVIPR